jgi:hypothetical protein
MKFRIFPLVCALGALLATAGCDSVGQPLSERFATPPAVKQVVEAPSAKVFPAAVAALREMGYTIRRAKEKDGEIEAYGRIGLDDSFRSSSQHNCKVVISVLPDGACDVQLEVRDQVEERTGAGGMYQNEKVRPYGGIHERFYDELRRRL